jgi:hypothetical protein
MVLSKNSAKGKCNKLLKEYCDAPDMELVVHYMGYKKILLLIIF